MTGEGFAESRKNMCPKLQMATSYPSVAFDPAFITFQCSSFLGDLSNLFCLHSLYGGLERCLWIIFVHNTIWNGRKSRWVLYSGDFVRLSNLKCSEMRLFFISLFDDWKIRIAPFSVTQWQWYSQKCRQKNIVYSLFCTKFILFLTHIELLTKS